MAGAFGGGGTAQNSLAEMMAQSRLEQGVITSKMQELRTVTVTDPRAGYNNGYMSPLRPTFAEVQETTALREQLARLDAALVERDAEIEALSTQYVGMEKSLKCLGTDSSTAALWEERFEEAQRLNKAQVNAIKDGLCVKEQRENKIALLTQYCRIQEKSKAVCDGQVERLITGSKRMTDRLLSQDIQRKHASDRVTELEDGFVRCVGRVTNSLVAGVATVVFGGQDKGAVRFVVLRLAHPSETGGRGAAILEIYEEPDSMYDLASVTLIPGQSTAEPCGTKSLRLLSNPKAESVVIGTAFPEELDKWAGALYLVGLLSRDLGLPSVRRKREGR